MSLSQTIKHAEYCVCSSSQDLSMLPPSAAVHILSVILHMFHHRSASGGLMKLPQHKATPPLLPSYLQNHCMCSEHGRVVTSAKRPSCLQLFSFNDTKVSCCHHTIGIELSPMTMMMMMMGRGRSRWSDDEGSCRRFPWKRGLLCCCYTNELMRAMIDRSAE